MPLYQLYCESCTKKGELVYPEAIMNVKTFDKFCKGEETKECPICGENLKHMICPPRRINIH